MSLSIYISGEQKDDTLKKIRQLERLGHHITYNWTLDTGDIGVAYKAAKSMDGIEKADIIVALINGSKTKVWFEIGVGIAHKKDVVIVGNNPCTTPFYCLPQIIHKSKWINLIGWIFNRSNIEMNRLALKLLPRSSFVERYVSIGWITDILKSNKKRWGISPPFGIVIVNSCYHDVAINAVDMHSEGYSLIDDRLHLNILTDDGIYYSQFEYHNRGKYWVEISPDLAVGVYYLRFDKEKLMTGRYGMTFSKDL